MNEDLRFIFSLLSLRPNHQLNKSRVGYLAARAGFSLETAQSDPLFSKINIHRQRVSGGYNYEYWYVSSYRRKEITCLLKK
jgi:hypothetical protein